MPVEIGDVVESALVADLRYIVIVFHQHLQEWPIRISVTKIRECLVWCLKYRESWHAYILLLLKQCLRCRSLYWYNLHDKLESHIDLFL